MIVGLTYFVLLQCVVDCNTNPRIGDCDQYFKLVNEGKPNDFLIATLLKVQWQRIEVLYYWKFQLKDLYSVGVSRQSNDNTEIPGATNDNVQHTTTMTHNNILQQHLTTTTIAKVHKLKMFLI